MQRLYGGRHRRALKILVVDDHEEFRKYLYGLLESQPRFAVVGEAANGVEAIDRARELQPDVVVLDINMPVLGGIEAAEQIASCFAPERSSRSFVLESGIRLRNDDRQRVPWPKEPAPMSRKHLQRLIS